MTSWPASIPLPLLDFGGGSRNTTLQGDKAGGRTERRERFKTLYKKLSVAWLLDIAQYESFQTFFLTTLSDGCSLFSMELRYPKNSGLTEWVVRFLDGYDARHEDGVWLVQAELDMVRLLAVALPAALEGS